MRKRYIFALAFALVGCQSDSQVRSQPALNSYRSTKSADQIVGCLTGSLAKRWNASGAVERQRFVGQVIVPGQEYDVVPVNGFINGHYLYTANVKSGKGGSTVNLYKGQMMLPSITTAMRQGVADCI